MAARLLESPSVGVSPFAAADLAARLSAGAAANVVAAGRGGVAAALSGPLVRADVGVLGAHVDVLAAMAGGGQPSARNGQRGGGSGGSLVAAAAGAGGGARAERSADSFVDAGPADHSGADASATDGGSEAALAAAVATLLAVTSEELVGVSAAAGRLSTDQAVAVRAVLRRLDGVGHSADARGKGGELTRDQRLAW
ncbi:hypothetical protein MMPV_009878 [Pyropia vietnamensis]